MMFHASVAILAQLCAWNFDAWFATLAMTLAKRKRAASAGTRDAPSRGECDVEPTAVRPRSSLVYRWHKPCPKSNHRVQLLENIMAVNGRYPRCIRDVPAACSATNVRFFGHAIFGLFKQHYMFADSFSFKIP